MAFHFIWRKFRNFQTPTSTRFSPAPNLNFPHLSWIPLAFCPARPWLNGDINQCQLSQPKRRQQSELRRRARPDRLEAAVRTRTGGKSRSLLWRRPCRALDVDPATRASAPQNSGNRMQHCGPLFVPISRMTKAMSLVMTK